MITSQLHQSRDLKAEYMLMMFSERRFAGIQSRWQRFSLLIWNVLIQLLRFIKPLLDISIAVVALIVLSPIMILTALAIKLDSPGPVLFKQIRIGKLGEPFFCYKFRSMHLNAEARLMELQALNEADGPVFKMRDDPRVTRVGRIIRRLSIDELPQLFNVLRREMSMVGPRPALPHEVDRYSYEQGQRLRAMPGITGLQQVSGRSDINFQQWIALDLQYIAEPGLRKDLVILIRTVAVVLSNKGAY